MNKQFRDSLVNMSQLLEIYPFLASNSAIDEQNKLRRMIRENAIPFIIVDGKIRFPLEIIELWLAGHRFGPKRTEDSKISNSFEKTIVERGRNEYFN